MHLRHLANLFFSLCSLTLLCGTTSYASEPNGLKAGVFNPPRMAPDFSLHGSDGKNLSLSQYRGKVVMLSFGFTSCTEVCPVTLAVLAQTRKQLGAAAKDVQIIYITVDPERDDAEHMRKFLEIFDPTFIGGTGTGAQLSKVREAYGITATKRPVDGGGYGIVHSSYVYLIDRAGNLSALMPYGHTAVDFVHDVTMLLKK